MIRRADLRCALRAVYRAPLAFVVTTLSLGLAIGAVTAVFTVINALWLRPPIGFTAPERLAAVFISRSEAHPFAHSSYPDYLDIVAGTDAFESVAATGFDVMRPAEGTSPMLAEVVTGNYFRVAGIALAVGRPFLPEESAVGRAARVLVISHDLWRRRFKSDPSVVGRTLGLNGQDFTIVGVAPGGMTSRYFGLRPDIWIPLGIEGGTPEMPAAALTSRARRELRVIGRLRQNATLSDLRAQLAVLEERLRAAYPEDWADSNGRPRRFSALSEREARVDPANRSLFAMLATLLLGVAGLVLLVACTNVMSLFLAQAGRRRREIGVRLALGASRGRIVSMLLTEGLLPGLASGGAGLLLAAWTVDAARAIPMPYGVPFQFDWAMDWRVATVAFGLGIAAMLVFALIPAIHSTRPTFALALRADPSITLRAGRRLSPRNAVVVVQCATTLVLLAGAALFARGVQAAGRITPGIDPDRVATITKRLPADRAAGARREYVRALRDHLAARPDVEDAHISRSIELTGGSEIRVAAEPAGADAFRFAVRNSVTPGYLEMFRVPIIRGRTVVLGDVEGAPLVAVVTESFARALWSDQDPLGRRFVMRQVAGYNENETAAARVFEVVGIARNGRYLDLSDETVPYCWTSIYQDLPPMVSVSVKGRASAQAALQTLREAVPLEPGEVPVVPASTLAAQLDANFFAYRALARALGWGGLFGLSLAMIGVYGVVAFTVADRSREMAVRLALGAAREQLLLHVVRHALRLVVVGTVIGFGVAVPLAALGRSMFFGVSPLDAASFGGTVLLLLVSALLASAVPARRVLRIDPFQVLREE
jgi:predicted permease